MPKFNMSNEPISIKGEWKNVPNYRSKQFFDSSGRQVDSHHAGHKYKLYKQTRETPIGIKFAFTLLVIFTGGLGLLTLLSKKVFRAVCLGYETRRFGVQVDASKNSNGFDNLPADSENGNPIDKLPTVPKNNNTMDKLLTDSKSISAFEKFPKELMVQILNDSSLKLKDKIAFNVVSKPWKKFCETNKVIFLAPTKKTNMVNENLAVSCGYNSSLGIFVTGLHENEADKNYSAGTIYNLATGEKTPLDSTGRELRRIYIDEDRKLILGASKHSGIDVWDLDGKLQKTLKTQDEILDLAFSSSSNTIVAKQWGHWGHGGTEVIQGLDTSLNTKNEGKSFSDSKRLNGQYLACDDKRGVLCTMTDDHQGIKICSLHEPQADPIFQISCKHPDQAFYSVETGCLFYPDYEEKSIKIYDVESNVISHNFSLDADESFVFPLSYHENDKHLVTFTKTTFENEQESIYGRQDAWWVSIWDIVQAKRINRIELCYKFDKTNLFANDDSWGLNGNCHLYFPKDQLIVLGSSLGGNLSFWNLNNQKLMRTIQLEKEYPILQLSYDKINNQLMVAQRNIYGSDDRQECCLTRIDFSSTESN